MSKITRTAFYRKFISTQVPIPGIKGAFKNKVVRRDTPIPPTKREIKVVKLSKHSHLSILLAPGQIINAFKEGKRQYARMHPEMS